MGKSKPPLCFVDDGPDEIRRFKSTFGDRFTIGAGQTLDDALRDLRSQGEDEPSLCVLDMYFPRNRMNTPEELASLSEARQRFLEAENEYRLTLARFEQSSDGGFQLANSVRQRLGSNTGIVFFTRKGTLDDAIQAYEQYDVLSVIKKPDPTAEEAKQLGIENSYDAALEEMGPFIYGRIDRAIRKASFWGRYRDRLTFLMLGILASIIAGAVPYAVDRAL